MVGGGATLTLVAVSVELRFQPAAVIMEAEVEAITGEEEVVVAEDIVNL